MIGWPVLRNGIVCTGAPSLFMCGRVKAASQAPSDYKLITA